MEDKKNKPPSLVTEEIKSRAEIYYGNEKCKEKSKEFLREAELPNGLIPIDTIIECGFVRETGFFWLKRNSKEIHKFETTKTTSCYAPEITGYAEKKKIKKLTGIKSKEFLIWFTLSGIIVDDSNPLAKTISFKTTCGLFKTYPVSAFEIKEI